MPGLRCWPALCVTLCGTAGRQTTGCSPVRSSPPQRQKGPTLKIFTQEFRNGQMARSTTQRHAACVGISIQQHAMDAALLAPEAIVTHGKNGENGDSLFRNPPFLFFLYSSSNWGCHAGFAFPRQPVGVGREGGRPLRMTAVPTRWRPPGGRQRGAAAGGMVPAGKSHR